MCGNTEVVKALVTTVSDYRVSFYRYSNELCSVNCRLDGSHQSSLKISGTLWNSPENFAVTQQTPSGVSATPLNSMLSEHFFLNAFSAFNDRSGRFSFKELSCLRIFQHLSGHHAASSDRSSHLRVTPAVSERPAVHLRASYSPSECWQSLRASCSPSGRPVVPQSVLQSVRAAAAPTGCRSCRLRWRES